MCGTEVTRSCLVYLEWYCRLLGMERGEETAGLSVAWEELERREREERSPSLEVLSQMARIAIKFASIERAPMYSETHNENDAEHSYMLGLVAAELSEMLYSDLNVERVRAYSQVHDLVELETGDMPSLLLTREELDEKDKQEKLALVKLVKELPLGMARDLIEYEEQAVKEARYVKAVDKLLPITTDINMIVSGQSAVIHKRFNDVFGIETYEQLVKAHEEFEGEYNNRFGQEFPELVDILAGQRMALASVLKSAGR